LRYQEISIVIRLLGQRKFVVPFENSIDPSE